MGSAEFQGKIWGMRAEDWANGGEGTSLELFKMLLKKININGSTNLLDVGCGSGLFCKMAADSGFNVSGFDASEELISIARRRVPGVKFESGDMEALPYEDRTFDLVTGTNSFQFAGDIVKALKESGRVTKEGGSVLMTVWGKPEESDASAVFAAVGPYFPPPPDKKPAKPPLYTDGMLAELAVEAGLKPANFEKINCNWYFENEVVALRSILSAGLIALAIQSAGEKTINEAVSKAIMPFSLPDGSYQMKNTFYCQVSNTCREY